jgi:large subunit ribosomal protein L3
MKGILGIKKDMTQIFREDGNVIPVTLIDTEGCFVCAEKKSKTDGYNATVLGIGLKKHPTKPEKGKYKKLHTPQFAREFGKIEEVTVGDKILSNIFEVGEKVNISGVSKGKGFTGVVKRWGFHGGPRTHGQSDKERHGGSIGSGTTPGNVKKGKKMPGRSGGDKIIVKNLEIVEIKDDILVVKGAIPGARGGLVIIKSE